MNEVAFFQMVILCKSLFQKSVIDALRSTFWLKLL